MQLKADRRQEKSPTRGRPEFLRESKKKGMGRCESRGRCQIMWSCGITSINRRIGLSIQTMISVMIHTWQCCVVLINSCDFGLAFEQETHRDPWENQEQSLSLTRFTCLAPFVELAAHRAGLSKISTCPIKLTPPAFSATWTPCSSSCKGLTDEQLRAVRSVTRTL